MTSPYLQQPLVPLAVALPRMLKKIEAELANEGLQAGKRQSLRQRAELIRSLLRQTGANHLVCAMRSAVHQNRRSNGFLRSRANRNGSDALRR